MKTRCRELIELGDNLFSGRQPLLTLWQSIAEQFYPERADFTVTRYLGTEFASHLMTGAPAMARRDLANSLSSMLRPRGQPWFSPRTSDERVNKDTTALQWLDDKGDVMRRVMYDNRSRFVRATKEGDNDYASFGQTVISIDLHPDLEGLLYRCWHLRDVVWTENAQLEIDGVHRKWKLSARALDRLFKGKVSVKVKDAVRDDPLREINCRHIVIPSDEYDLPNVNKERFPFVSLYIDCDNDFILEETPQRGINYVIPRWQTVSGSQYAYSPATVIAIADARMLQQMTLTLLEAGQKSVDPPMIAMGEVIQGGVNLFAGGVTYVDSDYDERTGEALRPIPIDRGGFQWGNDREQKIREMISEAFYLNQITLPDISGEMTAYEVQKRVEEYIRKALPLFEPMEAEYNGALCDQTFEILLRHGAFGPLNEIPQVLRGQEIRFSFESPLQAAASRANAQAFQTSAQLLKIAAEIDPTVTADFDVDQAFRDALEGAGAPNAWIVPKEQADQDKAQLRQQQAQAAEMQQVAQQVGGAAHVAQQVGQAGQSLNAAFGDEQVA